MLTIAQLSQFDFFQRFRQVAGYTGLSTSITNVVIMEYESVINDYSGFGEGDFVLTSLFFARDSEQLLCEAIESLISIGVSGIAIKSVCYHEIPQKLIILADEKNIPIFFFDGVYMEDIIIEVSEYQKSISQYHYFETLVDELLEDVRAKKIQEFLLENNVLANAYYSAMYLKPIFTRKSVVDTRIINKILYEINKVQNEFQFFVMQYHQGFLFVFYDVQLQSVECICEKMKKVSNYLETYFEFKGFSYVDEIYSWNRIHELICACIYTEKIRESQKSKKIFWKNIGIKKSILPLFFHKGTYESFMEQLNILKEYDQKHESMLLQTLVVYVKNQNQMKTTAEILFQHPNTIRYRISKIQQLLNISEEHFNFYSVILVEFYELEDIFLI